MRRLCADHLRPVSLPLRCAAFYAATLLVMRDLYNWQSDEQIRPVFGTCSSARLRGVVAFV
jgi:hypothetical protein